MVTQEEDDLALPGDSPLWEFLGALVRAEAAILGDAADEERRRLDATPGQRGAVAEPAVEPRAARERPPVPQRAGADRGAAAEAPARDLRVERAPLTRRAARRRADDAAPRPRRAERRPGRGPPRAPPRGPEPRRRRGRARRRGRRGRATARGPPRARRRGGAAGAGRRAARAAAFLRDEVALLLGGGGESELEGRHAEALSSLVRRELKSLLNEAVAIAHGTGSVRFNFDDPAALLHRPSGPPRRRRAGLGDGAPRRASAVRAKLASGGFDRLEALAGRVRGADAPGGGRAAATAAPAPEAATQVDAEAEAEAPAAPAAAAPLARPRASRASRRSATRCGAARAAAPSAADAIAHLTALRDAAAAAAAAAGSKKKRKKRKRDKQKPLFDDLANSGVFLFPEIAAFPAEAD
ncbi:tRNA-Phe hydroxylase [Aureococcus anophagefferens]|nr:tRNA-Phe hydroxylase [Aureococcus anophagefferens]